MKNEYVIDWPLLKKWTNEGHHTGIRLAFYIFWCVMLVVFVAFAALCILAGQYSYAFFFVLFAFISFYRAFLWNIMMAKQQYRRLVQTYGNDSWVRTICFEDDEIVIQEEKTEIKYLYSDVLKIVEKGEKIDLILPAKAMIRLYRSKFVDCSWEECKAKILENNPNVK
jgi:hypothetical protein